VRGLVLVGAPTRLARIPMVWQVHAIEPDGRFHQLGARWASVVVVPSSAAVELLPSLAAARRLVVAPVPFPESVRREAPVDLADGIRLVTVARLHPEKGIDVLVDALPAVRERHPAVVAQVVGGPHPGLDHVADDLARQARDLDVAANLELLGFHDRPHEVVARGRVYVHPARSEVLPIAVLEAMATGVPVVATDVGGTRELIEPGVTGMLVPPDDPAALAAAIVAVLDDPALADRLRLAAFARVAGAEFTTAAFVDTVVACWEAAADEG
jgi:glycosyltransferase involved in cell wall biosynthesis